MGRDAHSATRRALEAAVHAEAVLPPRLFHARVFKPPQLDQVATQAPPAKREALHSQSRVQSSHDLLWRVGREKREHEAVVIEAFENSSVSRPRVTCEVKADKLTEVAVERDEVRRRIDRLCLATTQILSGSSEPISKRLW